MVMQALGGLGLNFLGNMANQMMSYNANKKLQENQARLNYEYAEKSARNQPTWNRAGLESAGYNPMLAVQNSTSGANSSWTGSAHADSMDSSLGTDMIANAQSFQRLDNETKTAEATQDEAYANADKAKAEKNTILEKLPYVSQKEKAEISNIEKDSMHKEALIHQIDETIRLREKELELQQMGLNVQMRGQDKAYNASTYATNMNNETQRGIRTDKLPFGFSSTYYDLRGKGDSRFRNGNIDSNDQKYWHYY